MRLFRRIWRLLSRGHRCRVLLYFASRILSGEVIVQVLFMWNFLHLPLFQCVVIQAPSDVIVAAEIIQECIFLWKAVYNVKLLFQQSDVVYSTVCQVVAMVSTL